MELSEWSEPARGADFLELEPTEATLAELKKKLDEEEGIYLEFLAKIDRLSANPAHYERDPQIPELLSELNRSVAVPAEEVPSTPSGLKGLIRRMARGFIGPELARLESALARKLEFDSTLVQFLNRLSESANASGARAAEFASALIGFAQRVDRLADAKDRLYASLGNRRSDLLLESMDKRVEAVRLGIRKAQERLEGMSTTLALARAELTAPPSPGVRTREQLEEAHYVAFEERFRGSSEEIRGKLSAYVPCFRGAAPVVRPRMRPRRVSRSTAGSGYRRPGNRRKRGDDWAVPGARALGRGGQRHRLRLRP